MTTGRSNAGNTPRGSQERSSAGVVLERTKMGRARSWTTEQLAAAVKASRSVRGVIDRLGLRVCGGNYNNVQAYAAKLGLDTSHWTGQGHRVGSGVPTRPAAPLRQVLVRHRYCQSGKLKRRLLSEGIFQRRCAWCGRKSWLRKPIPLELDHIDGDHLNNEIENLRLLCPNCHAQTPTYRGRNAKYPNIPSIDAIRDGIARCESVLAYALELGVTPDRVQGWLRSDRLRARDKRPSTTPEAGNLHIGPGGEIGETHGT